MKHILILTSITTTSLFLLALIKPVPVLAQQLPSNLVVWCEWKNNSCVPQPCQPGYTLIAENCSSHSTSEEECYKGNGTCTYNPSEPGGGDGTGSGSGGASSVHGACGDDKLDTAIGCVPINDINALVIFFLRWLIGISGGIGLILIIFGTFTIITASGNPDKVHLGQQIITSAVAGIVFLIFSIFILRFFGYTVFHIPGF